MSESLKNLLKVSALGLSMAFVAGCATTADEGDMALEEVNAKAEEALSVANEARDSAMDAEGTAKAAQFQANRNSTRITELNEKIDRMFERSMQK
ncbi:MAG: Lpp/OprI family alanine-zipper lipoprotein [Aquisalimonadaceae bacterium]